MKLDEIMNSANNLLDTANEIMDDVNNTFNIANNVRGKANNALGGVNDVRSHYQNGKNYYNSEQRKMDFAKAEKIDNKSSFVSVLMIVLWVIQIIGTIVMCVSGNDMILQYLHL